MLFNTGGSERLRIDTSGNVGIGTSSPSVKLQVVGKTSLGNQNITGADAGLDFVDTATTGGNSIRWLDSSGYVANITQYSTGHATLANVMTINNSGGYRWSTGGSERMRIESGGNVGINTTSPNFPNVDRVLSVNGSATSALGLKVADVGAGSLISGSGFTTLGDSRAATVMVFSLGASERMRIDSSGNLLVGATAQFGSGKGCFSYDGTAFNGLALRTTNATLGSNFLAFYNSSTVNCGSISQNGTTTVAYTTSSDYRLKENIAPMTGALDVVSALKPVTYKWKADGSSGQGFIAHELQEIVPDCVVGKRDAVDTEGNPKYQGIDTSFLVATLTAAIQEQQALIETLTTRLNALEGK
jgi:hypothetical protein